MSNQMHPAKALQTAVFAISHATHISESIRGTDITVLWKHGHYMIQNGATLYKRFDRNEAIETLQQLLIEGRN